MNRSFVSLSLAGNRLPYLVNPVMSKPTFQSFRNIKFTKSFSSFLIDYSKGGHLKFQKSQFNKLLSPALQFISDSDIIESRITSHQVIHELETNVLILDTAFIRCASSVTHGGALLFDHLCLAARIDKCTFQKCYSRRSGGAIYGCFDNISIFRTCFEDCQALEQGHAFFINLNDRRFGANVSETTISHCSTRDPSSGKAAILFLYGNYQTQFNNFTDNHALSMASTICAIRPTNFTSSFTECINCSSFHLMKFNELNLSLLIMFSNFIDNTASVSLFGSSSGNNIAHCVFIRNRAPNFASGQISFLQMAYCVVDTNYTFVGLSYVRTPHLKFSRDPAPHPLRFAFAGGCRILEDEEGLDDSEIAREIAEDVPEKDRRFVDLFKDRFFAPQAVPTPRDGRTRAPPRAERTIKPATLPPMPGVKEDEKIVVKPRTITPGRHTPRRGDNRPGKRPPRNLFTPTAPFTASETFFKSRTFLPSLQFTASASPRQSLVPYVLYSAAGFVVFAVLTSFLFLKSSDAGYNLMTPSESADSRISDYASSTSTTVTITGESSSVVV